MASHTSTITLRPLPDRRQTPDPLEALTKARHDLLVALRLLQQRRKRLERVLKAAKP